jgi:DNA-binding transcriptional ArsR family regulator
VRSDPLDRAFQALADRTRRSVIDLLRDSAQRAGELATRLRVSPPALTRHLRILRECRLVEELDDPADGRASIYQLRRETFAHLREWVDHVESLWHENLSSFAAHVAKKEGK